MRLDRPRLKFEAKAAMRGRRPSVFLVSLALLIIQTILSTLVMRLQFPGLRTDDLMRVPVRTPEELERFYAAVLQRMLASMEQRTWASWALTAAIALLALMLSASFVSYCLHVARRQEAGFGHLFDAFGNFFRILWLNILRGLLIFLWSLPAAAGYAIIIFSLLGYGSGMVTSVLTGVMDLVALGLLAAGIILGLMALYRYSMALYVLLDAPDKPASVCLRESRLMTRGHKGELLMLDLSLLGWRILSQIPFVAAYTMPYIGATKANFYRALSGRVDAPPHVDYRI